MSLISLVIPCYNEEQSLDGLHARVTEVVNGWKDTVEIILVDDGSTDGTWEKMRGFHARDGRWKAVRLSRNFGHQSAVAAGLNAVSGDAAIVLDADLQDPPEILHRFIEKWREGYEVVYAVRRKRKEFFLKRFLYNVFYRMLSVLTSRQIPRDSGDFGLMDRRVVELMKEMPEHNRFIRGMRAWMGFRQTGIEYERDVRRGGKSQYTTTKLVKLAIDGIFSFSFMPLRLVTWLGIVVAITAFIGAICTLVKRLFSDFFTPVPGFATTVISVLFIGGIQLISLGIIGEYIGRIYDEVKSRPVWVERENLGLSDK